MSAELFPIHSVCHLFSVEKTVTLQYLLNISLKRRLKRTYILFIAISTASLKLLQGIGTSYKTGIGGVVIMCMKSLFFSIKEIPCPESNRIIGAELFDKKGGR